MQVSADPGTYDATLVCHDVAKLQSGLLPLHVEYGSDADAASNILQLWIIPVARVWQVRHAGGS